MYTLWDDNALSICKTDSILAVCGPATRSVARTFGGLLFLCSQIFTQGTMHVPYVLSKCLILCYVACCLGKGLGLIVVFLGGVSGEGKAGAKVGVLGTKVAHRVHAALGKRWLLVACPHLGLKIWFVLFLSNRLKRKVPRPKGKSNELS